MRNFDKIFIGILVAVIALTVISQGREIAVLQEKIEYLSDEVLFTEGLVQSLDADLSYFIDKEGAE